MPLSYFLTFQFNIILPSKQQLIVQFK